jgi:parallel beta-helix repeat protein
MYISDSIIRDNTLRGAASEGLCLNGNGNVIKRNVITSRRLAGLTLEDGQNNIITNNQITALNENPPEVVDVNGGPTACENTWRNNDFSTDSEGDGPNAGCIR